MPHALRIACLCWFGAVVACTRLTAVDWNQISPEAEGGADPTGDGDRERLAEGGAAGTATTAGGAGGAD